MSKVVFPEALFERVRAGNVILCTGVRLAAAAGMPTWEELLEKMAAKLDEGQEAVSKLIKAGELLTVVGYLRRKLGSEAVSETIVEAFGSSQDPSATHKWLHQIPFHAALSTGYDCLLEHALRDKDEPQVFGHTDGAVLRIKEDLKHYVVKAHGDVNRLDELVLSARDYKTLIGPNQPYRAFLQDLYRTRTLLLVGYHHYDPDFMLFMDRLVSTFRDAVNDHYAILPAISEPEADELYANYRLRVIPFDAGKDEVQSLTNVLKEFKESFHAAGGTAEAVDDPAAWLESQLSAVSLRIDVVTGEGLTLTQARLQRIRDKAEAIDLVKLNAETLCRLGNVRLYLGEVAAGIECYNAALEKKEDMAQAHLNLHHALAEIGDFGPALEHLQKATKLDESTRVAPKRYKVEAVIGRGSTGTVYRAKDSKEKRDVTLKVLKPSSVKEHVSPELWLEESAALVSFDHPNIAKLYSTLVEGGRCIQVTESLAGKSLSRRLADDGPLGPEEAAKIMEQICAALIYAHGEGVLHLDVMPGNVFLREDGTVALMDFRSGRAQKGRAVAVNKEGEGYWAPELLTGAGADARADVYSLGATLYTMVTGTRPVGSFPRIGEVNPAARRFDQLVNHTMRAVPDYRPHTVADFAKELAGTSEAVALPESADDLAGWLEVLAYQPENKRAQKTLVELEQRYREGKDWENLVTLLLGRLEVESDHGKRLKMMREVARVFENEEKDSAKALTTLLAAFRDNPEGLELQQDIERIAAATGLWSDVVQEYSTIAQNQREPKAACDWWVRIGNLYAEQLKHDDYAVAAYHHALSLDASRLDALSALADVFKQKGDYKEYAKLLTRMVRIEDDPSRKAELLEQLAATYTRKLKSDEEAILTYRKVLEVEPAHAGAVTALGVLFRKAEMWDELAELMRSRIPLTEVAEEQTRYRRELGEVYADHLKKPEEAIGMLSKVIEADPSDAKALTILERLYTNTGRKEEYLKILDKQIQAAKDDADKAALYNRLAAECEAGPGGRSRAAEYLVEVHKLGKATEDTYRNLVRLYWELKEYPALVETYGWHVEIAERPEDRAVLYAALGRVYDEHLKDAEKALEAYNQMLQADEKNKIGLAALARLYEQKEVWGQAVQMLERLVVLEDDKAAKVGHYHKIGLLQLKKLEKLDEAEANLVKALELDGAHVDTLLALGDLYQQRKDYGKAARMLHDAARQTPNELERVRRLFRAAEICREDLKDNDKALDTYMELMAIDPEHIAAGEEASKILLAREAYQAALPLCEMLVRKTEAKERPKLLERNLRLGEVALKIEAKAKALTAYRAAYDIDPTSHQALRNLANLLFDSGEFEEAGKLFQALLVHRRDSMETEEIVSVFFSLSTVKEKLGEPAKALNMIEKALDVDPSNAEVLERAIQVYEEKGDFEAVLRCKTNLLKAPKVAEGEAKVRLELHEEIGDLLVKKLKRSADAIKSYAKALEIEPGLRRIVYKKMEAHVALKQWDEALGELRQMVADEKDPAHRYRLHHTAALILRDELKRSADAAEEFDLALQDQPTNMMAFEALKELYTAQKSFKKLIRAYRLLLKRLPEDTPKEKRVQLWREVAQIAQEELQDGREAIIALEMISKLDPKADGHEERLAELYASAGPDAYDKAVQVNQRILDRKPLNKEAYKELYRLYTEMGARDKAYCVSGVLTLLRAATNEERRIYDAHKPDGSQGVRRARAKLSDDALWRELIHHKQQVPVISEMLSIVTPLFVPMALKKRDMLKLRAADQLQPQEDPRAYAQVFHYVSDVLEQSPTEIYLRTSKEQLKLYMVEDEGDSKAQVLFMDPGILERNERELVFHFARTLSLMRSEHQVLYVSPTPTVLRALMLACIKLTNPDYPVKGDVDIIDKLADAFYDQLPASHVDMLAKRYDDLVAAAEPGQAEQWMRAVELSIDGAGLLICDDLETAARLAASTEPLALEEGLTTKERVAQLFRYAGSERYFAARQHLGLDLAL